MHLGDKTLIDLGLFSTVSSITSSVHSSLLPIIDMLSGLGAIVAVLFILIGGYSYITSSGNIYKLAKAKKIILNSVIGLVIIISGMFLSNLFISSYGQVGSSKVNNQIPLLSNIKPKNPSSGIVAIIIKAIAGVFGSIIETIGSPFIKAISYFTAGTSLGANNKAVYDLWLSSVGIADGLLFLVIVLLGFRIMSFSVFGFTEVSISQLLPQIGFAFVLINSSIYIIDFIIQISNIMIKAISNTNVINSFWNILKLVINQSSVYSLAVLLIMLIFIILSVILIIYYLLRIVTIYLGIILAPIVILLFIIPGLRDLAVTALKKYISTIFVLFFHVVIIELAASLMAGMAAANNGLPDPLMSILLGLATLVTLLKTQGVISNLSYLSTSARYASKSTSKLLGGFSQTAGILRRSIQLVIPGGSTKKRIEYTPFSSNQKNSQPSYYGERT